MGATPRAPPFSISDLLASDSLVPFCPPLAHFQEASIIISVLLSFVEQLVYGSKFEGTQEENDKRVRGLIKRMRVQVSLTLTSFSRPRSVLICSNKSLTLFRVVDDMLRSGLELCRVS